MKLQLLTRDLIEAMLIGAGFVPGASHTHNYASGGELIVRTPEKQVIADNDAAILSLVRKLAVRDESLVGQYIRAEVQTERYEGEIIEVGFNFWRAEEASFTVKRESVCLLHPDLILAIGEDKIEADKIFDERKAALQPSGDDDT